MYNDIHVLEIVKLVLYGELNSLDKLYLLWPEDRSEDSFIEIVFDDVERVIEHLNLPKMGKINEIIFEKSNDYRLLVFDFKLLTTDLDSKTKLKIRKELNKIKIISLDTIDILIEKLKVN